MSLTFKSSTKPIFCTLVFLTFCQNIFYYLCYNADTETKLLIGIFTYYLSYFVKNYLKAKIKIKVFVVYSLVFGGILLYR